MGARKEGFKKRTVAGKDRGYRIVGAFVKKFNSNKRANILLWRPETLENTMYFVVQSYSGRPS